MSASVTIRGIGGHDRWNRHQVADVVVDLLEPVDVDDRQAQGLLFPAGAADLALQVVDIGATVLEAGQRVDGGGFECLPVVQRITRRKDQRT